MCFDILMDKNTVGVCTGRKTDPEQTAFMTVIESRGPAYLKKAYDIQFS